MKELNHWIMNKIILLLFLIWAKCSNSQIITTIAGNGIQGFSGDSGQAVSAAMYYPAALVFDNSGNLYVSDMFNYRIRRISSSGVITTFAGNGSGTFGGDNGPAVSAQLSDPHQLAFDAKGNMYVTDHSNNRIRKIDTLGIITTVAGDGTPAYSGDGGPATSASMFHPSGIAIDKHGNFYIGDLLNNRIRKVDTSGIITTFAGTGAAGFSGDGGPATSATIQGPDGMAFDSFGNLFFCDFFNHRIRKIDTLGVITTIAGTGIVGYTGDGGPATAATLQNPTGLIIDMFNNLFIVDEYNHVIRAVNGAGVISTVAGNGTAGFSGDGGLAINAELNQPCGIAFDSGGNMLFGDLKNNRVRRVSNITLHPELSLGIEHLEVYPNPAKSSFTLDPKKNDTYIVDLFDTKGTHIFSKVINSKTTIDATELNEGIYVLRIKMNNRLINTKIVIIK